MLAKKKKDDNKMSRTKQADNLETGLSLPSNVHQHQLNCTVINDNFSHQHYASVIMTSDDHQWQ